jgi:hypothetical protein
MELAMEPSSGLAVPEVHCNCDTHLVRAAWASWESVDIRCDCWLRGIGAVSRVGHSECTIVDFARRNGSLSRLHLEDRVDGNHRGPFGGFAVVDIVCFVGCCDLSGI